MDTMSVMSGLSGLGELGKEKRAKAPRAPKPKKNAKPMASPLPPTYEPLVVRVQLPDYEPPIMSSPPMALGQPSSSYQEPVVKVTKLDKLLGFGGSALDKLFTAKAGGYSPQQPSAATAQSDSSGGGGVQDATRKLGEGAGGFVDSIIQTVKDNPLPFLVGGSALVLYKMQPGGGRRR